MTQMRSSPGTVEPKSLEVKPTQEFIWHDVHSSIFRIAAIQQLQKGKNGSNISFASSFASHMKLQSAVCMQCFKAKVKCDRRSPCGRCSRKCLDCCPQLRGRGRPKVSPETSEVESPADAPATSDATQRLMQPPVPCTTHSTTQSAPVQERYTPVQERYTPVEGCNGSRGPNSTGDFGRRPSRAIWSYPRTQPPDSNKLQSSRSTGVHSAHMSSPVTSAAAHDVAMSTTGPLQELAATALVGLRDKTSERPVVNQDTADSRKRLDDYSRMMHKRGRDGEHDGGRLQAQKSYSSHSETASSLTTATAAGPLKKRRVDLPHLAPTWHREYRLQQAQQANQPLQPRPQQLLQSGKSPASAFTLVRRRPSNSVQGKNSLQVM